MIFDLIYLGESESGHSIVRFDVYKNKNADEDDDYKTSKTIVPFQIAYAVSIHKAQGLEYDSVKIVITDEVDELISHNIFYTAITHVQRKSFGYTGQPKWRKKFSTESNQEILMTISRFLKR